MLAALMCPKDFFLQPTKSQQTFCSNSESNIVSLQKDKYDDANCQLKIIIRKYNFVILHQRIKMREFQKLLVISF